MDDKYHELDCENDVINLGGDPEKFFVEIPMLKLGDLLQQIKFKLLHISPHDWQKKQHENWVSGRKQWLYEGKNCEVLHLGATNWKKGKVRVKVTVEFCPDEPEEIQSESPLDDIRKTIL
ncbi:hypothetical protein HC931_15745 [Candidatus Gracilibacteria bacterium]|nr:hypothetical protein [Candidatus Gracilibacteria bacterium]NJM86920.1 hypothetical protein [Hydrococcus sp. RU_2_2]NJP19983.1 hypothetical protein [Hydrococcus sp. CRU_1_1]